MKISILSVFPDLYQHFLTTSLIKRALNKGIVDIELDSFFSYVAPKERIDAPAFGPGAGMLLKPEVVQKAIEAHQQKSGPSYNIFFSPQGQRLDQPMLKKLAHILVEKKHIMLVSARYEGMDARVEEVYADQVISVGDYVLMGGDLPAMLLLEGLMRYIPGIIGKQESVQQDSFSGPFVDYPAYTEPVAWCNYEVPAIVRSGNHAAIERWRNEQAARASVLYHFDWVRQHISTTQEKRLALACMPSHYVALCHSDVLIGNDKVPGTTSVTSIDIHDIARSCKTYGVKQYWLVTPLGDQQKIVKKFLDFWESDIGSAYNPQRQEAVSLVNLSESIDTVIERITQQEGKPPILIATSARHVEHIQEVTFFDQGVVWQHDRPVLFLLGTGKGLVPEIIERCDYLLCPIQGFTDFNHLSVRSAAAIVLDRWLGIHIKR